jgi:hypothetical protein
MLPEMRRGMLGCCGLWLRDDAEGEPESMRVNLYLTLMRGEGILRH